MKKLLIACLFLIILTGCQTKQSYITKNLFYMDTVIEIKIYTNDKQKASKAFEHLEELYSTYQHLTDYYDETSALYQLNHGGKLENEQLLQLINLGLNWYNKSNGLLNINMGGITKIWHDFRETGVFPKNEELQAIDIDVDNLLQSDQINIDLGSIVKGYVTELAGQYLESEGLNYYLINAGGNVKVGKSYQNNYKIGITSPLNTAETFEIVHGQNISVVTSGSYERFYEYDGKLYHHIIDPITRYPANYIKSVTVIGKDSGQCDALSTILFLMNVEQGQAFIKNYDVDVIWFTNDNQIIKSEGFKYE